MSPRDRASCAEAACPGPGKAECATRQRRNARRVPGAPPPVGPDSGRHAYRAALSPGRQPSHRRNSARQFSGRVVAPDRGRARAPPRRQPPDGTPRHRRAPRQGPRVGAKRRRDAVESVKAARRFNYSAQSVADLFTIAAETEMTVRQRTMIVARGKVAAQLGCRSGHRWLHLACLRTIADERRPLCWTDIFVDGRLAAIVRTHERRFARRSSR